MRRRYKGSRPASLVRVLDHEILPPDEVDALAARAQSDPEAMADLMQHVAKFAWNIASKYDEPDVLFADALRGVEHATRKYDPSVARFSTYAEKWVRQYCARARRKHRDVVQFPQAVRDLQRAIELADAAGEERPEITNRNHAVAVNVRCVTGYASRAGLDEDGDTWEEVGSQASHEDEVDAAEAAEVALRGVSDHEREILTMRYGGASVRDLADRLGVSRVEARKVEQSALRKAREINGVTA